MTRFKLKHALILLLASAVAFAGDFKAARVIEVSDASELGASVDTDVKADGKPTVISPAIAYRCQVTIALDGVKYTAIFPSSKYLNPGEVVAGDSVLARVEGHKLALQLHGGKPVRAKIINQSQ
jgi:hypothetical protein